MPDVLAKSAALRIQPETASDAVEIEGLVLSAFGPGRFAKTAERLRERAGISAGFVARENGRIVGSVRLWSVLVGDRPALFLGPIAVMADRCGAGLGADLVRACVDHGGETGILLVGDLPYFGRFGFQPAPDVHLPGPVARSRVLWRGEGRPRGDVRGA